MPDYVCVQITEYLAGSESTKTLTIYLTSTLEASGPFITVPVRRVALLRSVAFLPSGFIQMLCPGMGVPSRIDRKWLSLPSGGNSLSRVSSEDVPCAGQNEVLDP